MVVGDVNILCEYHLGVFFPSGVFEGMSGGTSGWKDGGSADRTGKVGVDGACTVVCPGDTVPELLGSFVPLEQRSGLQQESR